MQGLRGLPGGSSLAALIATRRGVRNRANILRLTEAQILEWADRTHQETGKWPKVKSGAISGTPGETWVAIDDVLRNGLRGLPGGSSLAARAEAMAEVAPTRPRAEDEPSGRGIRRTTTAWSDMGRRKRSRPHHTTIDPESVSKYSEEEWPPWGVHHHSNLRLR
jgi:hypothetical protein